MEAPVGGLFFRRTEQSGYARGEEMYDQDLALSLIAKWSRGRDSEKLPDHVGWSTGALASIEDFKIHQKDTSIELYSRTREVRLYPHIQAEVEFDSGLNAWTATGPGVTPIVLRLTDRQATDARILRELLNYPIRYRVNIHRKPEEDCQPRPKFRPVRRPSTKINLYWVAGRDSAFDWFMLATSLSSAIGLHEFASGSGVNRSECRRISRHPHVSAWESGAPPCFASLEDLRRLGYQVIDTIPPTRAVRFQNKLFVEGNRTDRVLGSRT